MAALAKVVRFSSLLIKKQPAALFNAIRQGSRKEYPFNKNKFGLLNANLVHFFKSSPLRHTADIRFEQSNKHCDFCKV